MNRWTLAFADPELEMAFRASSAAELRLIFTATYLGTLLATPLFGILDRAFVPAVAEDRYLLTRWLTGAPALLSDIAFGCFAPRKLFERVWQLVGAANTLVLLAQLVVLFEVMSRTGVVVTESLLQYNVTAFVVIVLGAHTVLGLRFATAASVTLPFSIFYVAWVHRVGFRSDVQSYVAGWVFNINVVSGVVSYVLERLRRRSFLDGRALEAERAKSDVLLHNVLPQRIAARLKADPSHIADGFSDVTILFADIVGFTDLSSRLTPAEVVAMLNRLFTAFDELAEKHGLEKIKTIGDAYMVVGGLPEPRDDHAEAVAEMALAMREAVARVAEETGHPLKVRIGLNSGPVVAGVIGKKKFAYDLWGDAVNTASRMESHGLVGEIQISESTFERVKERFDVESRGVIAVKGKGELSTWLLRGKRAAVAA